MTLDLKIPPLLLFALIAVGMKVIADQHQLALHYVIPVWLIAITAVCGVIFGVLAVSQFHQQQTTVDPVHPERAEQLVTTGIFQFSRNPMYTGLFLLLTAWAMYLGVFVNAMLLAVFFSYIKYFQIIPEEKILAEKFSDEYQRYKNSVRRWL